MLNIGIEDSDDDEEEEEEEENEEDNDADDEDDGDFRSPTSEGDLTEEPVFGSLSDDMS
jgi:hypothetical protein